MISVFSGCVHHLERRNHKNQDLFLPLFFSFLHFPLDWIQQPIPGLIFFHTNECSLREIRMLSAFLRVSERKKKEWVSITRYYRRLKWKGRGKQKWTAWKSWCEKKNPTNRLSQDYFSYSPPFSLQVVKNRWNREGSGERFHLIYDCLFC